MVWGSNFLLVTTFPVFFLVSVHLEEIKVFAQKWLIHRYMEEEEKNNFLPVLVLGQCDNWMVAVGYFKPFIFALAHEVSIGTRPTWSFPALNWMSQTRTVRGQIKKEQCFPCWFSTVLILFISFSYENEPFADGHMNVWVLGGLVLSGKSSDEAYVCGDSGSLFTRHAQCTELQG